LIKVKKKVDYLVLTILTTVMIFSWIALEVYAILTKPAKINVSKKQMTLVDSRFDSAVLADLNRRLEISQEDLENLESRLNQPDEISSPESATPAAEITSPATGSGELLSES
jgi:hypothetical protein